MEWSPTEAHNAVTCIAHFAHTHPASWGGSFTVGLGRASSVADLTGIDGCRRGDRQEESGFFFFLNLCH